MFDDLIEQCLPEKGHRKKGERKKQRAISIQAQQIQAQQTAAQQTAAQQTAAQQTVVLLRQNNTNTTCNTYTHATTNDANGNKKDIVKHIVVGAKITGGLFEFHGTFSFGTGQKHPRGPIRNKAC